MDHLNAWAWFTDIAGTIFENHSDIGNAALYVPDAAQSHPIVRGFGGPLTFGSTQYARAERQFDEFYNYRNNMANVSGVTVLLQMAHESYSCKCNPAVMTPTAHQAAWIRQYKGGRQFVTTLGGVPDNSAQNAQTTFHKEPSKNMLHRAFLWAAGDPLDPVPIRPKTDAPGLSPHALVPASLRAGLSDLRGRRTPGGSFTLVADGSGKLRLIRE
jgi:hypothetical protein